MQLASIVTRTIQPGDNAAIAKIIRDTLEEFGANHPKTVYFDPTTDRLFELFQKPRSIYYIAEDDGKIAGGAGIYPSDGLPGDTCELVKMYLVPNARGIGLGGRLIGQCLEFANNTGYRKVYLETMPELTQAMKVYEKFGFDYLAAPMGKTGHSGCSRWMMKEI